MFRGVAPFLLAATPSGPSQVLSEEAVGGGLEMLARDLKGGPIEGVARKVLLWGAEP